MKDTTDLKLELELFREEIQKEQKERLQRIAEIQAQTLEIAASLLEMEKQRILMPLLVVLYELLRQLTRKFISELPAAIKDQGLVKRIYFNTITVDTSTTTGIPIHPEALAGSSELVRTFFGSCSDYDNFAKYLTAIRVIGAHQVPTVWRSHTFSSIQKVAELIEFAKDQSVHQEVWGNAPRFLKLVQHIYKTDDLTLIMPKAFY